MARGSRKTSTRQPLSPKLRFEVLKRDYFRCKYCGANGDNILLHVDHINPVSSGGDNSLVNLITSCSTCNSGKGAVKLDDTTVLDKQRLQLEELQALREQRELMVKWREELRRLDNDTVAQLANYWAQIAPGFSLDATARQTLQKHLKKYSVEEITEAMDECHKYLDFKSDGSVTDESCETAWRKVGEICYVRKQRKDNPEKAELYKIRKYIEVKENWFGYYDPSIALEWLETARSWGVSIQTLRNLAADARNWKDLRQLIDEAIDVMKGQSEQPNPATTVTQPRVIHSRVDAEALRLECDKLAKEWLWRMPEEEQPTEEELKEMSNRFYEYSTRFILSPRNGYDPNVVLRIVKCIAEKQGVPWRARERFEGMFTMLHSLLDPYSYDGPATLQLFKDLRRRIDNPNFYVESDS